MQRDLVKVWACLMLVWLLGVAAALAAALLASPAQAQPAIPPQAHAHRADLTRAARQHWGLGAPLAALAAQVHQESGWRAGARSPVGAAGMAQFMPATARWWCQRADIQSADCQPTNPTWALRALVGYDKYLFDRTPPHLSDFDRLWVALRAYNGGLGHWQAEARSTAVAQPSRVQVDQACGRASRAALHCTENLAYPQRILLQLQPLYRTWGALWLAP